MLPPWFMIFRTMFSTGWHISQTEVHLYLFPTRVSCPHIGFFGLISSGNIRCCFLDNFCLRIKRNPVGYLWHFQHWVVAKPDISVIVFEWVGITIIQYQGMPLMYRNTISASMLRHSLAFSLSDSRIKWLSHGWCSEEVKGSRTCPWRVISIDMFLPL